MKEKKTKSIRYDRRKNKVMIEFEFSGDIKDGDNVVGKTIENYKQEYEPEWVKNSYRGINAKINSLENGIKRSKLQLDTMIIKGKEDEIEQFIQMQELAKQLKQKKKEQEKLEAMEHNLKELKKEKRELSSVMKKIK
jgi:DNA polymerase III delta prime subunit